MALPFEGDTDFGRQGTYELTGPREEMRPISINPRNSAERTYQFNPAQNDAAATSVSGVEDDEEEPSKISSCLCGCCGSIPKVILILLGLLVILFIIFSIPLVFALTQTAEKLSSTTVNDGNDADSWPSGGDPLDRMGNDTIAYLGGLLPPNVTLCRGMGFLCVGRPDIVVGTNSLCDGTADCPDGSDEVNCEGANNMTETVIKSDGKCQNGAKFCKNLNKCLPKRLLCDGTRDCNDGSDEDGCDCKQCTGNGKVLCKASTAEKGFCLHGDRVCNGIRDCPNGEDEDGCPGELKLNETEMVYCKDGKSYSKIYACLGNITACDGIEKDCQKYFNEKGFKCNEKEDKSVTLLERCDGRSNCPNGEDEENCSREECAIHPFPMYMCSDGKRCFRKDEACRPYSRCPAPSKVDNGFCAVFGKSSLFV